MYDTPFGSCQRCNKDRKKLQNYRLFGSNEKQLRPNLKVKQLVLVSNLVLIALQLGPYCEPKQVVFLEASLAAVSSKAETGLLELVKGGLEYLVGYPHLYVGPCLQP